MFLFKIHDLKTICSFITFIQNVILKYVQYISKKLSKGFTDLRSSNRGNFLFVKIAILSSLRYKEIYGGLIQRVRVIINSPLWYNDYVLGR